MCLCRPADKVLGGILKLEFRALHSILRKIVKGHGGIALLIGGIILLVFLMFFFFAPLIAPYDPIKPVGPSFSPPTSKFIMGTDNFGRDVFSRVIWGTRIALTVAVLATLLAAFIGIPLGLFSGYKGGAFDRILTMIMDSIYSFPGLILAIAIAAMLGPGIINISVSIATIYVPTYFRVVRNQVNSIKAELYVEAARALGATDGVILRKYIFRGVVPTILVILSMNIADAILTEAGLSFLGLGIPPPTPDWGFDLSNGQRFLLQNNWWMVFYPGLMIVLITLGFSLLGEGLQERFNPKLKER
ncbi:MAG: ABC transporter permease [Synergistetes bacterium]|nr:ABC transporter permease [Synergistota bacterium]